MKHTINLLLVEDSTATAMQVKGYLRSMEGVRFDLEIVRSLADAIDALAKDKFDAILLDLGLPDSFGLDTFIRIRKSAINVPTVIFTGVDDEKTAVEAVRLGEQGSA